LVHISELDHQFVQHPSEVLSEGQEVQVLVLSVDRERQRIGLSRKRLLPEPSEQAAAKPEQEDMPSGVPNGEPPDELAGAEDLAAELLESEVLA